MCQKQQRVYLPLHKHHGSLIGLCRTDMREDMHSQAAQQIRNCNGAQLKWLWGATGARTVSNDSKVLLRCEDVGIPVVAKHAVHHTGALVFTHPALEEVGFALKGAISHGYTAMV